MENIMPFVYWGYFTLNTMHKVDTGECARLVQMYLPHIGHTTTWKPGERVVDILERGGQIEPGTAIATFVNGRYPQAGHRHAAFYEGPVTACSYNPTLKRCPVMGLIIVDQWNPHPTAANPHVVDRPLIGRRTVNRMGQHSDGSFPRISDNADAFYVIER
jgi:hypothetical protein